LYPISLGVGRKSGAKGTVLSDRLPGKSETEKTLHRDGFTCRCCGFTSKRFQRVVADPVSVQDDKAFATVCTFCEMALALDRAGPTSGALLIWLPELTQAELNHTLRALYVAKVSKTPLAAAATRTLEVLTARRAEAKKRLGTDDPLILATALIESVDDAAYAARTAKLEGIRLMAGDRYLVRQRGVDVDVFPQMLSFWVGAEGPFGRKPVSEWEKMFESVTAKVGEKTE
jgi:hypothetical protein